MKIKYFLLSAGLTLALGSGSIFALNASKSGVAKTSADGGSVSNLVLNLGDSEWANDGAKFVAFVKNEDESISRNEFFSSTGAPKIFEVSIDTNDVSTLEIWRVSSDFDLEHKVWEKKKSDFRTNKLRNFNNALKIGYRLKATVTGESSGTFELIDKPVEVEKFTSANARVWLCREAYLDGYTYTLHYWDELGLDKEVLPAGYNEMKPNEGDSDWLVYFDVKINELLNKKMQFKVYKSIDFEFVKATGEQVYESGNNSKLYYTWTNGDELGLSQGSLNISKAYQPNSFKKVFEGYFSCSNSKDNGYGCFEDFSSTWIKKTDGGDEHWFVDGELSSSSIKDFNTVADYSTGNRSEEETDLWTKYNLMQNEYLRVKDASHFYVNLNSGDNIALFIVVATSFAFLVVGCFIAFKRKKVSE